MRFAIAFVLLAFIANAQADSFLFGTSADQAFGNPYVHQSKRYHDEAVALINAGYQPLRTNFGAAKPTPLKILVKSDAINSFITMQYLQTLSKEKANLMALYDLSNSDYNHLAAIAFGILGRETKFGASVKYIWKETNQDGITGIKILRNLLTRGTIQTAANSRGLTQIKAMPDSISKRYCFTVDELTQPSVAAIATVGFLAESLKILKRRVRNADLSYITDENLFDYVLYVYFGSMKKLVNAHVGDPATPSRNIYIQTVRGYIRSLALYEKPGFVLLGAQRP